MVGRKRKLVGETEGTVRPLGDRILVEMEAKPTEQFTSGGICLPPSVEQDRVCARGTVRGVGPGTQNKDGDFIPLDCKPGWIIMFGKYAGTELKIHDKEYRIMSYAEILAVIGEEEPEEFESDEKGSTEFHTGE